MGYMTLACPGYVQHNAAKYVTGELFPKLGFPWPCVRDKKNNNYLLHLDE